MAISLLVLEAIKRISLLVITTIFMVCFVQASERNNNKAEKADGQQQAIEASENNDKIQSDGTESETASKEATKTEIANNIISKQLERDLQLQYQQLQKVIELEDAFSPSLAENYFGYAGLLKQAQRYEEAVEAYTTALHIEKVNHGIYSLRQRSALQGLFNIYLSTGESKAAADQLHRILWLEEHNADFVGTQTFSSLLELGHYYIDLFETSHRVDEQAMSYLQSANNAFVMAENKYEKLPITELLMPYGEIALVNYYLGKEAERNERSNNWLAGASSRRGNYYSSREAAASNNFMLQSFRRAENYLKQYIVKASAEKQLEQIVHANMNFADFQLLFRKWRTASEYYQLAWQQAQKLQENNPLRLSLNKPVKLPAFNYAVKRPKLNNVGDFIEVPIIFDVSRSGLISNVRASEEISEKQKISYKQLIRSIKGRVFRPAIIDGKMVTTEKFSENVKVFTKNKL